ncbi:hypothetical protein NHX12_002721, partial [Muraenolepis orangiensis]
MGGVVVVVAEDKQKKKADDLWASFLSDVGTRPMAPAGPPASSSTEKVYGNLCYPRVFMYPSVSLYLRAEDSSTGKPSPSVSVETKAPEPRRPAEPSTVTITRVFDFAGEEVRVTKEVAADSREAKGYLKTSQQEPPEPQSSTPSRLPGPSAKRLGGMSSVLGQLGGKKLKMSTLEKSKMDWDTFKSEEGITEELAIHNRGKEG